MTIEKIKKPAVFLRPAEWTCYQLAVPSPEIGMAVPRYVGSGFAMHWKTALHLAKYSRTSCDVELLEKEVLQGTPTGLRPSMRAVNTARYS